MFTNWIIKTSSVVAHLAGRSSSVNRKNIGIVCVFSEESWGIQYWIGKMLCLMKIWIELLQMLSNNIWSHILVNEFCSSQRKCNLRIFKHMFCISTMETHNQIASSSIRYVFFYSIRNFRDFFLYEMTNSCTCSVSKTIFLV